MSNLRSEPSLLEPPDWSSTHDSTEQTHVSSSLGLLYLHHLWRLPSVYWNRLDKLSRDADYAARNQISYNQDCAARNLYNQDFRYSEEFPAVWKEVVGGLVKEWETLNVVSALSLPLATGLKNLSMENMGMWTGRTGIPISGPGTRDLPGISVRAIRVVLLVGAGGTGIKQESTRETVQNGNDKVSVAFDIPTFVTGYGY
ncbi:hypothetical protein BDN72DRAFT_860644 [Pluteus cervinus]|uniref:Uncharacterized protein n=1 Tax=Pluteus cervinus TaxID=181527 RepID=A0ACD3AHR6_9AGAR|nr:hypothetical protein BDN72DRAFT_860644 [Pluteus cervinus]